MSEPTPRPWTTDGRIIRQAGTIQTDQELQYGKIEPTVALIAEVNYTLRHRLCAPLNSLANAELIVKAVNSHDMLVDALERLVMDQHFTHCTIDNRRDWMACPLLPCVEVKPIISKAKGETDGP